MPVPIQNLQFKVSCPLHINHKANAPNAKLKIFLKANAEQRAVRRFKQLSDLGNLGSLTVEQIKEDIEQRDIEDSTRAVAPLKKAEDAIEIDSTLYSIDEVTEQIIRLYQASKN